MQPVEIEKLYARYPLLQQLKDQQEVAWFNPNITKAEVGLNYVGLGKSDVLDATARLERFSPLFKQAFPETELKGGLIESELAYIDNMKEALEKRYSVTISGHLLLKKDSHLPISGSVKARGGIYEVLVLAEKLALKHGLLTFQDSYKKLLDSPFQEFFSQFEIVVGSTGNLGMSIGLIGAKLGFNVTVHMSSDAREWKKQKLRKLGVNIVEHEQDYSVAVQHARDQAARSDTSYFVDDENSTNLFLGYSVAGERIKKQIDELGITVDEAHPLIVYLPCGVGGAPGGISFGLKLAFGDNVHCIFAEPTRSPCMLVGVMTDLHDQISVQDIGLDNRTEADGLAVGRPSAFVGKAMQRLVDGYYTIEDDRLYQLMSLLSHSEDINLEPSALAGMLGPVVIPSHNDFINTHQLTSHQLNNATHIVWATGGGLVPEEEMQKFLAKAATTQC